MELNEAIRNLRIETGMNRKVFAEHFGIPLRTVEDWEANRRTPPEYIPRLLCYQWKYEQITKKSALYKNHQDRNINIIIDPEGNKIVMIHDSIFRNKQNINWSDVEKYLEQYIGELYTIAEDGEKIYIGKDLPDEYAHSDYSAKLKGALAKTKANAVQAIPEMIEISTNGSYSVNTESKHRLDAKYGWYRYDSRFAIAVYDNAGEIERYNVFKARMIIRYDADGKKYLYDVINIKKEPSTPLG
ncbi:MAG: transcriptional regulator [Lachnospiraceae bacterium]|nr:transcriptional regulator [Lachnospiraceae bacterium]